MRQLAEFQNFKIKTRDFKSVVAKCWPRAVLWEAIYFFAPLECFLLGLDAALFSVAHSQAGSE